jgi:MoxR-like ATPase
MAPTSRIVYQAIRLSARTGAPIRVPPLLLVGPPGIGTSAWARRLAEMLEVPSVVVD